MLRVFLLFQFLESLFGPAKKSHQAADEAAARFDQGLAKKLHF